MNSAEKTDNLHTMVYSAADVENNPDIALTRGGLILFALLSGGDYSKVG
jgi:holliday junction resolvase YEN1